MTEFEPDSLSKYLKDCEGIIYDKNKTNGKHQVGESREMAFAHDDNPFVQEDNTTSESKSQEASDKKLDDDRDTSLDPRTLLTNALENAAVTEDEKNFLKAYKNQIDILNKQTKRLAEIKAGKELSKKKGTAEERTAKANEASLMPPEGVYLRSERLLFCDRDGDIKDATQLTESDLRYLLEQVQNGELEYDTYIPVARTTPKFYIDVVSAHSRNIRNVDINIMKVPLASRVEHMIQNMEESDGTTYEDGKTPHGFSIDDIIKISKEMIHPKYIVLQRNGRYAEVVSFFSEKRKKQVVLSIDFAEEGETPKNFKYEQYMNGYNGGYYNIIVTEYEPTDLKSYLKNNEIVYDRQRMNGKYQVGSGRIVTVTHDTPFIQKDNTTSESKSQEVSDKKLDDDRDTSLDPRTLLTNALENAAVTEDEKNFRRKEEIP